MENLAHTLCGLAIAESHFSDRIGRKAALITAAVASNVADLDAITWPLLGRDYYMNWHRGMTHSLLALLLIPPVLAWIAGRVAKRPPKDLLALCYLGYGSHLLLDVPTIWGTMLLLPFDDTRFSLPWVFIVDVFYWLILSLPWWLPRWTGVPIRTAARGSLALLGVYALTCGGLHHLAVGEVRAAAERQGVDASSFSAYPGPFLPVLWNGFARTPEVTWQGAVQAVGGTETTLIPVGASNRTHPAVAAALKTEAGERFVTWWAGEPVAQVTCTDTGFAVLMSDLKFASPWLSRPTFSLLFKVDRLDKPGEYQVVEHAWRTPGDEPFTPQKECPARPTTR